MLITTIVLPLSAMMKIMLFSIDLFLMLFRIIYYFLNFLIVIIYNLGNSGL